MQVMEPALTGMATAAPAPVRLPAHRELGQGAWVSAAEAAWQEPWRAAFARYTPGDLGSHPDWCASIEATYPGSMHLVVVRCAQQDAVVPVIVKPVELDCQIGEVRLLPLRPRVLQLSGALLGLPEDERAYAAFFRTLLANRARWHALNFAVPAGSFLEGFLERSPLCRGALRRWQPAPAAEHWLIELPQTFEEYAGKFTSKTRKNRNREVRILEQRGAVELACFRRPDQVDAFLQEAGAISGRSYQHRMLRAGLRQPIHLRERLRTAAAQGWLRSYVLRCGGATCSYLLGYQFRGRYYYSKVGYDPAWTGLCAGTVLQWLVLQDLYGSDTPAVFDFGGLGPQMRYFGNRSFMESNVYYFRAGAYSLLVRGSHAAARGISKPALALLDRHELKPKLRNWLRRLRGC
ncbi:MAG TPA: GNAT family N-acetyltransferase [Terriglobales bacterium]|nr:GNAT family N-acetyltransferase [Terriglobales bacterium]